MKRVKELLWFVIPLVLLGVLPILYVILWMDTGFVSGSQYLRLLLEDEIFYRALLETYLKPLVFSILFVGVFAFVQHKITIKPTIYRLSSMAVGCVVAFGGTLLFRTITHSPLSTPYFQSHMPTVTVTDGILCLQIGILAAFAVWLAEWIAESIKKRLISHKRGE